MALPSVLFDDVVAVAEATDDDASTDETVPALVDVEDKTVGDEVGGVMVEADVDVAPAAVVLAGSESEVELALGAWGSPVESPSQVVYTAAYSISSMFP